MLATVRFAMSPFYKWQFVMNSENKKLITCDNDSCQNLNFSNKNDSIQTKLRKIL